MAQINRDPFARQETHRERVYGSHTCKWCGNVNRTPKGRKFLFQYRVESDGGRKADIPGLFDSIDCMRSCHG